MQDHIANVSELTRMISDGCSSEALRNIARWYLENEVSFANDTEKAEHLFLLKSGAERCRIENDPTIKAAVEKIRGPDNW